MKNFVLCLFFILSIGFVSNVLALEAEGILNGKLGSQAQHKYLVAMFAKKFCFYKPTLIGSGVLVATHYVLSAAHHFVYMSFRGRYELKPNTYYVHLGAADLYSDYGELVLAEAFYLLDYNITTGHNDLILIKIAGSPTMGERSWEPVLLAGQNMQEQLFLKGRVSSHGEHSENNMDRRLRFAVGKMVHKDNCDNILDSDSSQICIKMYKDDNNRPRGLCKNDGGAPFVIREGNDYYLIGIARKPKINCDDTERGAVYTDVRQFEKSIISIILGRNKASHTLQNHPPSIMGCLI